MSGQVALPQSADVVLHAVALLQPRLLDPLTGYWEAVTKMHVTERVSIESAQAAYEKIGPKARVLVNRASRLLAAWAKLNPLQTQFIFVDLSPAQTQAEEAQKVTFLKLFEESAFVFEGIEPLLKPEQHQALGGYLDLLRLSADAVRVSLSEMANEVGFKVNRMRERLEVSLPLFVYGLYEHGTTLRNTTIGDWVNAVQQEDYDGLAPDRWTTFVDTNEKVAVLSLIHI